MVKRNPPVRWQKIKKMILPAGLIIILAGMFFFLGTHQVSGVSMEPTFQDGDCILIVKQLRPERGDIVTFAPVDEPNSSYVKRVVGVPGDHVLLRGTTLYLVPKEETMPEVAADVWEPDNLPESTQVIFLEDSAVTSLLYYENIPEDQYFVEGDNREHSTDSRNFGWIDRNQIEGIVKLRYFPFSKIGVIS